MNGAFGEVRIVCVGSILYRKKRKVGTKSAEDVGQTNSRLQG